MWPPPVALLARPQLRKAMKAMRGSQAKVETIAEEALAGMETHFFLAPTEAGVFVRRGTGLSGFPNKPHL